MPEQKVGGARQQEAPGRTPLVDRTLDGVKERRFALNLVDRHGTGSPDDRLGIAAGGSLNVEVVEGQVPPCGMASPNQRALAGLPRPGEDDRRHRAEVLLENAADEPRERSFIHVVNDHHSWCG